MKKYFIGLFVFVFSVLAGLSFNCNIAKADAASTTESVQVTSSKAVTINTNKEIVVPKTVPNKTSSSFGGSLSRGGNSDLVAYAMKFMGRPYVWGASGPSAFDCSGFTAYVYNAFGIYLDHYTGSQFQNGSAVSRGNLAPGDLVFFNTDSSISHVGMYIGDGQFIHASSGSRQVTISNLGESYYNSRYAGGRRIK